MTIGTGIVVSIGIICATLVALAIIGYASNKNSNKKILSNKITEEILKNFNKDR